MRNPALKSTVILSPELWIWFLEWTDKCSATASFICIPCRFLSLKSCNCRQRTLFTAVLLMLLRALKGFYTLFACNQHTWEQRIGAVNIIQVPNHSCSSSLRRGAWAEDAEQKILASVCGCVCVCVCVRERERCGVCVCVCVRERARERELERDRRVRVCEERSARAR